MASWGPLFLLLEPHVFSCQGPRVLEAKGLMMLENGHPSLPGYQLLQSLSPHLEAQLGRKRLTHHQKAIFIPKRFPWRLPSLKHPSGLILPWKSSPAHTGEPWKCQAGTVGVSNKQVPLSNLDTEFPAVKLLPHMQNQFGYNILC